MSVEIIKYDNIEDITTDVANLNIYDEPSDEKLMFTSTPAYTSVRLSEIIRKEEYSKKYGYHKKMDIDKILTTESFKKHVYGCKLYKQIRNSGIRCIYILKLLNHPGYYKYGLTTDLRERMMQHDKSIFYPFDLYTILKPRKAKYDDGTYAIVDLKPFEHALEQYALREKEWAKYGKHMETICTYDIEKYVKHMVEKYKMSDIRNKSR